MSFASKCSLNLPFPAANTDQQHQQNYAEIQRWADRLLRSDEGCLPTACDSNAFRASVGLTTVNASASGSPTLDAESTHAFYAGGIAYTGSGTTIPIPDNSAASWVLTLNALFEVAVAPTSGSVTVTFNQSPVAGNASEGFVISYVDFLTDDSCYISFTDHFWFDGVTNVSVSISNTMDVAVTLNEGHFSGHQECSLQSPFTFNGIETEI